VGVAGGVDYCALTAAAIDTATAAGGVCAACAAAMGAAAGCAAVCPDCINALDAWLASCANNFDVLNYATLEAYAGRLVAGSDCFDYLSLAARPYAASYCSGAFDHVVQYTQVRMRCLCAVLSNQCQR
jgi:hypothetical protein